MVTALQALARRFRLAILSNVANDPFALTAWHLPVESAAVIATQQVGRHKHDRRNFRFALAQLGVAGPPAPRIPRDEQPWAP